MYTYIIIKGYLKSVLRGGYFESIRLASGKIVAVTFKLCFLAATLATKYFYKYLFHISIYSKNYSRYNWWCACTAQIASSNRDRVRCCYYKISNVHLIVLYLFVQQLRPQVCLAQSNHLLGFYPATYCRWRSRTLASRWKWLLCPNTTPHLFPSYPMPRKLIGYL